MIQIIDGIMLLLSSSLAASILGKATVIASLGLIGAWLARRRPAAVRHAVLGASFAVLLGLPIASALITPFRIALPASAQDWAPPALFSAPVDAAQPAAPVGSVVAAPAAAQFRGLSTYAILFAVWIAGAAFFLLRMIFGLHQVRTLRRFGLPWQSGQSVVSRLALDAGIQRRVDVLLHESLPAPVTCGVVHPAIVLPSDTQVWDEEDLRRAIVHELEHVRRFDWASLCLARIACAVYWFHPLVWAAWRQLVLEAERSCDDAVLARSEATAYADQLVGLTRRLSVAQPPALAMANRSDLSARVGSVLEGGRARGRAGALLAAVACIAAGAIVLIMSPLRMVAAPQRDAQAAVQDIPKWDAVSVKRCANPPAVPLDGGGAGAGQSPDRYSANCRTLGELATLAYATYGAGRLDVGRRLTTKLEGFPGWATSERYTIEAKAQGNPEQAMMRGFMLQALLEDRFGLKVHPQTKEGKVYILSVAKDGPKIEVLPADGCTPQVLGQPRPANPCPYSNASAGNLGFDTWVTMDWLATYLAYQNQDPDSPLDAPVINRTGLTGVYHVRLEYAKRESPSPQSPAATPAASIFTAIQKLGLKLEAGKGPRQFIVFDCANRPSEN
jgi:uncharacterized protein (TIGR03435 family)